MRRISFSVTLAVAVMIAVLGGTTITAQDTSDDKYTVQVPGGLAFSEFKGYERWQVLSISYTGDQVMAVIMANPIMIDAYKAGIPGNGQPFPDGSQMAKVHWIPKKLDTFPTAMVPGTLHDVDFMVKDSKRFADSAGWGWGAFKYNAASGKFMPADMTDMPPQGNDAKCGLGCHTVVKGRDYVFTEYAKR